MSLTTPEPIAIGDSTVYSASNIYLVPSADEKQAYYLLYQGKWMEGEDEKRAIFYKPVTWNNQDRPVLNPE